MPKVGSIMAQEPQEKTPKPYVLGDLGEILQFFLKTGRFLLARPGRCGIIPQWKWSKRYVTALAFASLERERSNRLAEDEEAVQEELDSSPAHSLGHPARQIPEQT